MLGSYLVQTCKVSKLTLMIKRLSQCILFSSCLYIHSALNFHTLIFLLKQYLNVDLPKRVTVNYDTQVHCRQDVLKANIVPSCNLHTLHKPFFTCYLHSRHTFKPFTYIIQTSSDHLHFKQSQTQVDIAFFQMLTLFVIHKRLYIFNTNILKHFDVKRMQFLSFKFFVSINPIAKILSRVDNNHKKDLNFQILIFSFLFCV